MKAVQIRDVTLQVHDEGAGTPLLFVHGFPLDHTMWQHQLAPYAEHCRVIAPDLRGLGQSQVSGDIVTMEQHADDLDQLLTKLGIVEPVVYCGLSMGGYIGWHFYSKYPLRVAAIVAVDTRAAADAPEAAENRLKMAERVINEGPVVAVDAMLPKLFSPKTYDAHPEVVESVRQTILRSVPQGIAASQRGMAQRPDMAHILREVDVPTLVVVGEDDAITPVAEMRKLADAIPDANWAVIPAAGHMSPLENAQAFNNALSHFLTK